jgi:hypothetical protein
VLLRDAAIAPRTVRGIAAERVDILVGAGRINAIEPPKTVPMGAAELTIDASRLLVLPGMINGHVHSWDHFLKGCLENLTTELFMAQIRPRTPVPLTERQIYLRTVIGAIESLRTGATTIIDLGFLYDSNGWDDDLPYWDATSGARPILVVPYALDTNDMKFYHPNGFVGGREFLDYLNCALDVLLSEAERGRTRLLNVGLHLRICGRPARFWAVERFFERLQQDAGRIWIARRRDIAEHWLRLFPPPRR